MENQVELDRLPEDVDDDVLFKIWSNYAQAMRKRRPGSELEYDRFARYVTQSAYYYRFGNSYVFGALEKGNFVPTHFAPAGLREGIDLIKKLHEYDNVVFVVTQDLRDMLKKLGYRALPFSIRKGFRCSTVEKFILASNWPVVIKNLSFHFVKDKAAQAVEFFRNLIGRIQCAMWSLRGGDTDTEDLPVDLDEVYGPR